MSTFPDTQLKIILWYRPDRYTRPDDLEADQHFEQHVPCKFIVALDWKDFLAKLISVNPVAVGFNRDLYEDDEQQISDLIPTIQTISQKIRGDTMHMIVGFDCNFNKGIADRLIQQSVSLVPSRSPWGLDVATCALQNIVQGKQHIPTEQIAQLPLKVNKPVCVYFGTDWQKLSSPDNNNDYDMIRCNHWDELSHVLKRQPKLLIFHISMLLDNHGSLSQHIDMITTLIACTLPGLQVHLAVSVDPTTQYSAIRSLQKTCIMGLVPGVAYWGITEFHQAIGAMLAGSSHWPTHIVGQIKLNNQPKQATTGTIKITERQQQVLNLICNRGLSNKKIAQAMNITESTVKVHISSILRAYGVRNRTQLALAAREGLTA